MYLFILHKMFYVHDSNQISHRDTLASPEKKTVASCLGLGGIRGCNAISHQPLNSSVFHCALKKLVSNSISWQRGLFIILEKIGFGLWKMCFFEKLFFTLEHKKTNHLICYVWGLRNILDNQNGPHSLSAFLRVFALNAAFIDRWDLACIERFQQQKEL